MMNLLDFARQEAERQGVDPSLVLRVLQTESAGRPQAVSPKGAVGPMQLMPATAQMLGVNAHDPLDNIRGGVRYLAQQLKDFGSTDLALAAYNAGPGNVRKYGGVPPFQETQKYIGKIMGRQAASDDSDIFGAPASLKSRVNDDSDIFASPSKPQVQPPPASSQPTQAAASAPTKLSVAEKLVMGAADPIHGGAQLLTRALPDNLVQAANRLNNWLSDTTGLVAKLPEGGVDQQVRQREQDYQARRAAAGESGLDGWRLVGNVISPANRAIPVGGVGTSLGAKALTGAAGGAASAALAPVGQGDFWNEKTQQVGSGAVFGGLTPVLAQGVSRIISPKASVNPEVNLLKSEGVKPTVGQTLGGWANSLEEKAQSIPFVGDAIAAARGKAREQFNQAAINRVTKPIGQQVDGVGNEAVKQAGDLVTDAYNSAKSQLGGFRIDQQAGSELSRLRMLAGAGLEGRERSTFNRYFKDYVSGNRGFTAEKFKEFDSKIGSDIARFAQGDAYQQKLADALKEVQRIVTDNAMRAKPNAAQALKSADAAYANLVRLEGAATAAKGTGGVFTPGQLMIAVRGADRSVRDRATARGTALMQDLASAGNAVLGNKVPDSGTAGRLMSGAMGAAAMANPWLTGGGLLGGIGMYTPAAQDVLRFLVSSRPELAQPIAEAVQKSAPSLVLPASQVGVGLLR